MYKLLVVDDEPKIREVIREYAEFNGYEVTEAEDGMSAVGLCKLNHYDLVILDIMMPKLDGFSACKEIKKIQDVPIIMLSARGEEYDKLFGFELGIDDYIVKPFSPKELMARIVKKSTAENGEVWCISKHFWGYDFFGDDRTIDTHIKNLRNNLGPYRDYIVTLRGVGYKFEFEE